MALRPAAFLACVFFSLAPFLVLAQSAGKPLPRYVTSEGCVTCHQEQTSMWCQSHHALAWLQVSPDVQYLIDPGIVKGNDDTVVLGLPGLVHF